MMTSFIYMVLCLSQNIFRYNLIFSLSEKAYEISKAGDFPLIKLRQAKARSKVTAQSSDGVGVKSQRSQALPRAPFFRSRFSPNAGHLFDSIPMLTCICVDHGRT